MVAPLAAPQRPLSGGRSWTWRWREPKSRPWLWCRVYHRSAHTPSGITHRINGPRGRLDPHELPVDGVPTDDPAGTSVLYVAGNIVTAVGEVFGDLPEAEICPNYRIALLRPKSPIVVLDIRSQGAAMRIGALPSLATGDYPRSRTQEWARAIYHDQPVAGKKIWGIYYDAAHTRGPALALWNTDGRIEVVERQGSQDFALDNPRMLPRISQAAASIGIRLRLTDVCRH